MKIFKSIFLSIILMCFILPLTSAAWPLSKWDTCHTFNKTESDCDIFWCQITDCNATVSQQSNLSLQNITIVINSSLIYNRSDIDIMINNTNTGLIANCSLIARQIAENLTAANRDSVANRLDSIENRTITGAAVYQSQDTSLSGNQIMLMFLAVLAVGSFFGWQKFKPKKSFIPAKTAIRKSYQYRPQKKQPVKETDEPEETEPQEGLSVDEGVYGEEGDEQSGN